MYQPGHIDASSIEAMARSLRIELDRISQEKAQPADYISLNTLYTAPARIFDGMIVKADGSTWNPGSGAGVYVRVGSSWVKL